MLLDRAIRRMEEFRAKKIVEQNSQGENTGRAAAPPALPSLAKNKAEKLENAPPVARKHKSTSNKSMLRVAC